MPGMMDTILNLGLNPDTIRGLAKQAGQEFAEDCYRRFLTMWRKLVGVPVPDAPMLQLELAMEAVVSSWNSERARAYREAHGIANWLGTAVTVQAMVFGNHGHDSGTGVVFSRNPANGEGEPGLYGEWLVNAQGEDVVAGVRTPQPIAEMLAWNPAVHAKLHEAVRRLELHHKDAVDVEFTVEQGNLFILQCRSAKRSPEAALTMATRFVWEKLWTKDEALTKVTPEQVRQVKNSSGFEPEEWSRAVAEMLVARGLPASPGTVIGEVALDSAAAVRMAKAGKKVVLVRHETSPDDLPGMLAAVAIITEVGGATSHAAVVARGLGKPAIVGASQVYANAGMIVSVDGGRGEAVMGSMRMVAAAQKKEVNLFLRWWTQTHASQWPTPRLGMEYIDECVDVSLLINDFYLTDAMAQAAEGTRLSVEAQGLKRQIHSASAERIAAYLALAVSGELRHTPVTSITKEHGLVKALADRFGVQRGGNRYQAQQAVVERLKSASTAEQIEFLNLAVEAFELPVWGPSVGGPKWAQIARAALGFLTGDLTHSVFVDHAFDLQHNGGRVFDKRRQMITADEGSVRRQLDTKKRTTNISELFVGLARVYLTMSPEVSELYQRGLRLGLWQAEQKKEGRHG